MSVNALQSYPRPADAIDPPPEISDPTLPLLSPPPNSSPPYVPPSRGSWHDGWTRSTHVAPAAYPRKPTMREPGGDPSPKDILRRRAEHYAGRWERLESRGEVLWTVVERFVRAASSGDTPSPGRPITLFCVHANGLHKETFDETLRQLLTTGLPGGDVVSEVWTLDAVTHGEGACINASELPDTFDWTDHVRDILDFLLAYLPSDTRLALPSILPRLPTSDIAGRRRSGYSERRLVAIGHSQGGACVALAACDSPSLFDSIIFMDPLIVTPVHKEVNHDRYVVGAAKRRDTEEASSALLASPYFQRWDPAVFRAYVEHGMYEESAPPFRVRLKCSPYQEASSFSETRAPVVAWCRLAELPERVTLFWVLANKAENRGTGGDDGTPQLIWRRPGNSSNVRVPGAGHLIVQHAPKALADLVAEFLEQKYCGIPKARI
ncbi:hypothetical protein AURDEDRAFT_174561 [Auricularia subglabra TFB-10046 SS5]|uniref:AB hydrolase-1 domain-containing protein n=1 Tax=Auricularia subglabra (strain TFB-10046 / SS5) TaxID=717982 RepID=J0WUB7_AURST|nr:hypothetical protein AURDEDRAFT_174561 [Auricularia subglabra TFB-10046 SS5]